jgi:integrase
MPTSDPSNHHGRFETELGRLEEADIDDRDKQAIERFLDTRSSEDELSSLVNYCSSLRKNSERCHKPLVELEGTADVETFFREMRTNADWGRSGPMSIHTRQTYQEYLRMFLADLGREWAGDIEIDRPDEGDQRVNPNDILDEDDIEALIAVADRQRDVALVEFLADTGVRVAMVCSLRVGDVDLDGSKATYRPNDGAIGLKNAPIKDYPIIDSKASLKSYLRGGAHPRPNEPDAALFHAFEGYFDREASVQEDDGGLSPNGVNNRLRKLFERADIEKPRNAHTFKHTAVTRMAREGYSKQQIQHRVHWDVDTDMWKNYIHLEAEKINDDIFAEAGVISGDGGVEPQRSVCGNCREPLAPHHNHCPSCGSAATQPRRRLLEFVDQLLVEEIAMAESPELREDLMALRSEAKSNPARIPDIAQQLFPDHFESSSDS